MQCRVLAWQEIEEIKQDLIRFNQHEVNLINSPDKLTSCNLKLSEIYPQVAFQLKGIIIRNFPEIRFALNRGEVFLSAPLDSYRRLYTQLKKNSFFTLADKIKSTIDNYRKKDFVLKLPRNKDIDLREKVAIMGILNLTPDSFYDGGKYRTENDLLKRVEQMIEEGVDIIDVGGESTRPGAERIEVEEEIRRTVPYIEKITNLFDIPISIDTYKAKVAREALEAGAQMINDISGLRFDPEMSQVASYYDVPLVIMHIKGTPKDMQINPRYDSLMEEIISYLEEGIKIATMAGVKREKLIVDPGIGFGKTLEHNLFILKKLEELRILGCPILIGVSRKSFIGKVLNLPVEERMIGSLAATCLAVSKGARIVRTHDVKPTRQVVDLIEAILKSNV